MTCNEFKTLIQAYLDNELDTTTSIALLEHAQTCQACKSKLEEFAAVKNAVTKIPSFPIPASVRRQVLGQFQPKRKFWNAPLRWGLPLATGLALGVLATMIILPRGPVDQELTDDLVWNHIHALKSGHLIDVQSNDKHTVKPWFAGKTDFSPLVIDLVSDGFPLLGARAESIGNHDAAALEYTNGKHYIALYEWPVGESPSANSGIATVRGYHSSTFEAGGMHCCVISDASPDEVNRFQQAFLSAVANKRDQ
jgi:anti-sigma factor RsiW